MMYVNNTLWFCVAVSFFFFVSETSGKQELVKWKLWVGSIVHRLAMFLVWNWEKPGNETDPVVLRMRS